MQRKRSIPLVMFTLLILVAPIAVWGQESFTTIDYPGANLTVAMGINPRGDIVGYYRDPVTPPTPVTYGEIHGFFLGRGGFVSIDYPQATYTDIWAINPRGDIVGSYIDSAGIQHGFLLNEAGFTSIDVPGATFTAAFGINPEGDIVGHYGVPPTGRMNGFLLSNGSSTTYAHPAAEAANKMSCGMGINPQGEIVGHYQDSLGIHGFLLNEAGFTSIDIPGGKNLQAYGINPKGEIVGFYTEIGTVPAKIHGFFMDKWGAFTQVDIPGAVGTWVRRNNARGDLVGNYTTTDAAGTTTSHGFLMRR